MDTIETQEEKDKSVSPFKTLMTLLSIMGLLLLVMFIFPQDGIAFGSTTIDFPTTADFFEYNDENEIVLADSIIKEREELKTLFDSTVVISKLDSTVINAKLDSLRKLKKSIQGNKNAIASLELFFKSLDNSKKEKVRIIHYGDSQIESDRITSYIRNEFQKRFGGSGVGLFPIITVSQKWTLNNKRSKNWKRYAGFGRKNEIPHKKYGAILSFSRFFPYSETEHTEEAEAWITINKSKLAYRRVKSFSELNMYLSNSTSPVSYNITSGIDTLKEGVIKPNTSFQKIQVKFPPTPDEITVTFKGKNSPNIYGMSLESNTGIIMDNIPLRGSAGTDFTKQDASLLKQMYKSLSPDLIILQFGGNTIPYTKSVKQANDYGNWFKKQISFIKKLNPNVPIIVIGPSDMSHKNKTKFETYPYLEAVRDALKEATLTSNCLYWDMYEAMGGRNSMPKWVNNTPALANSDYIHFSSKGSVKIAKMFYNELIKLYDAR